MSADEVIPGVLKSSHTAAFGLKQTSRGSRYEVRFSPKADVQHADGLRQLLTPKRTCNALGYKFGYFKADILARTPLANHICSASWRAAD